MSTTFNKLLHTQDEKGFMDWDVIALDGSNIRALKAAVGAEKNIPMYSTIMGWVARGAALAPKSIRRQMEQGCR